MTEQVAPGDRFRLLIVDDEESMRHLLAAMLRPHGYVISEAGGGEEALAAVERQGFDFILCDVRMPGMDGMDFLRRVMAGPSPPTVLMMSAYAGLDQALEAMHLGAYDFITKPFKRDEVLFALRKLEEREGLRRENSRLRRQLAARQGDDTGFGGMVYRSPQMARLCATAHRVAGLDTTVLITGESGTGKELVARGIHAASGRAGREMISVNCGCIPEALMESELFGHEKGAFTGADAPHAGLFAAADGSTLLLDEIGELPLSLQVKLLRVLQEREIRPLGSVRSRRVDVRVLAATSRDLHQLVADGGFRQELYYRLNVINLLLPPLRERPEDIPPLVEYFLGRFRESYQADVRGVSPRAMSLLLAHGWPGNVRELENVMARAVVLAEKKMILPENLPTELGGGCGDERRLDDIFSGFSLKAAQKVMERRLISRALESTGGNRTRAAELLEISYPSLLAKMRENGLDERAAPSS